MVVVVVVMLLLFWAFSFYGVVIAEVGDGGGVGVGFLPGGSYLEPTFLVFT